MVDTVNTWTYASISRTFTATCFLHGKYRNYTWCTSSLIQDREFIIKFTQYYMENFYSLTAVLKAVESDEPTDVMLNFGVWFNKYDTQTDCGEKLFERNKCPHMPSVCAFFRDKHDFNVIWLTTTPSWRSDKLPGVTSSVPRRHNLNVETWCGLPVRQVLDRDEILTALQPNETLRAEMYFDQHHLHTQPYHAFNLKLMSHLNQIGHARWSWIFRI